MKRALIIVLAMGLLAMLASGCSCQHEWTSADCRAPKTCSLCGETEGEKTQDHRWEEATTEKPKTCAVCAATEGQRILTDSRFQTANCKDLFGTWTGTVETNGALIGAEGITVDIIMTFTFNKDGTASREMELAETEGIKNLVEKTLYQQFADQGMNRDQANSAMKIAEGKTIAEYAQMMADNTAASVADLDIQMVYYVSDGILYTALDWTQTMDSCPVRYENGVLYIEEGGQTVAYTKTEA